MNVLSLALPFDVQQPAWMWLALVVAVMLPLSLRRLTALEPVRRALAIGVRCLLILLLVLCLAGVEHVQRNDDLTVIFLMDRSHSVRDFDEVQGQFMREATRGVPADDRVAVIDFARQAYLQQLPMRGGLFLEASRLGAMSGPDQTNVAAALRLAMAMFPHDTSKRIVLMSDGNENAGDALTEARRARADGIPIDVMPLTYQRRNEVYFERMLAPTYAEPGEQVPLRMVLRTSRAVTGSIAVYHNGQVVELPAEHARVRLQPGSNTLFMKLPIRATGPQTYEAIFRPDDDSMDTVALNNRANAFTFVSGASRALIVSTDPDGDRPLADALRSEGVQVDLKTADELGAFDLLQMMSYATIVLSNVPATTFTQEQQEQLAVYVKDMGSGLIMLGGDEGFGAGGWIGSPIEDIMPLSFEVKHKRVIPRGALVLIMHSCEVPRGNYWGKEMAKKSVDTVSTQDYVGVLAYSYSPGGENWEVPLDLNSNRAAVKARIDRMQIGDMPDFDSTMRMAYRELTAGRGRDAAQKHVIILSDGDASPPGRGLLSQYANANITVSTIAIGWGQHVMEQTMRDIARATKGRYYPARNPRELPQIFVKESKVVRRPLIVEEPFRPQLLHAHSELTLGLDTDQEALPPLGGMILTSPREDPNVLIPIVRVTKDGEDPVLAHWQVELGKTVAFTSGFWPRWGTAWTPWPRFAKFWAQIVRWTMRQETPANFDTSTRIEGSRGRIVIDALDKDASYLNNLALQTRLVGPENQPVPLRFSQTGPGKYEASFDVDVAGQYLANVQVSGPTGYLGTIRTGVSVPFSPEYRDLSPNEGLLQQIAEVSGGRWLDGLADAGKVFRHDLPPSEARRPAWEWMLAWLVLPAFLLDVAVRRLASWLAFSVAVELVLLVVLLFGFGLYASSWWGMLGAIVLAELIGWTLRHRYIRPLIEFLTHGVTVLAAAGERSATVLDRLKNARRQVRDAVTKSGEEVAGGEPAEASPAAASRRRADRSPHAPEESGSPVGDLSEVLGGPTEPEGKHPTPPRRPEGSDEGASATERLLRAKKRARELRDRQE